MSFFKRPTATPKTLFSLQLDSELQAAIIQYQEIIADGLKSAPHGTTLKRELELEIEAKIKTVFISCATDLYNEADDANVVLPPELQKFIDDNKPVKRKSQKEKKVEAEIKAAEEKVAGIEGTITKLKTDLKSLNVSESKHSETSKKLEAKESALEKAKKALNNLQGDEKV